MRISEFGLLTPQKVQSYTVASKNFTEVLKGPSHKRFSVQDLTTRALMLL
jgi:hypothetical protein